MKYLVAYKIFEDKNVNLVDFYLSKMGTTQQDVIDIFQNIIDFGYEPKFELKFFDKDNIHRDKKHSGHETPLLKIKFTTDKIAYVGGSVSFNDIGYIENLYHSLSMFISMFKDKCKVSYELNNEIELTVKCQFDTEHDENEVTITIDELLDILESCTLPDMYSDMYYIEPHKDYNSIRFEIKPNSEIKGKLFKELNITKKDYIDNSNELQKIGKDICKDMAKKVSDKLKKDIRYVEVKGHYYDEVGTGLYLFKHSSSKSIDDGKENHMVFRISESCTLMKNYKFTIKSGFLSHKNAEIDLYSLEFRLF